MKIIIGLLLVATALAHPLAESEGKLPSQPIQPNAQSPVQTLPQKQEEALPANDSSSSESSSSESNESSEIKPAQPLTGAPASEKQEKSGEVLASIEKLEEPKLQPSESTPAAAPIIPEVAPTQAPSQIAKNAALPAEQPSAALPSELQEKPLALPTSISQEKPLEDPLKAVATDIKEEIVKPSEQKVEANPIAEEKLPGIKDISLQTTEATNHARSAPAEPEQGKAPQGTIPLEAIDQELAGIPVAQPAEAVAQPQATPAVQPIQPLEQNNQLKSAGAEQIQTKAVPAEQIQVKAVPAEQAAEIVQAVPATVPVVEIKPEGEKKAKSEDGPSEAAAEVQPAQSQASSEAPAVTETKKAEPLPEAEAKPEQKPAESKGEQQEILPKPSASSS